MPSQMGSEGKRGPKRWMAERRMPLQVHRIKQERTRETLKLKRSVGPTPTHRGTSNCISFHVHPFICFCSPRPNNSGQLAGLGWFLVMWWCVRYISPPSMHVSPTWLSSTMGMVANIPKLIRSNSKYREMLFSSKKDS
jgi:hypothetical protein